MTARDSSLFQGMFRPSMSFAVYIQRLAVSLLIGISLLLSTTYSWAQAVSSPVATEYATSQLLSEKAGIAPGETVTIALHQELQEGWHVYWQNPGDSGLPLTLKWDLPEGFVAGEIAYPVPHRLPVGPLVNFGHEGTPSFLVSITAPDNAVPGAIANLSVDATWLICEEICVPEQTVLEISIPVVASSAPLDSAGGALIERVKSELPITAPFDAFVYDEAGSPVVVFEGEISEEDLHYFPYASGLIEPSGAQIVSSVQGKTAIKFTAGFEYEAANLVDLSGVLTTSTGNAYYIVAPKLDLPAEVVFNFAGTKKNVEGLTPDASQSSSIIPVESQQGLFAILIAALLGGLILNIMPCVFPVIFIKAASLAQSAHEDKAIVRRHGLLYTLGVLVTFLGLAGVLLALRSGGAQLGWGFHLQSPVTVSIFTVVVFLIGLNLAGLFEIGTSLQGVGGDLASKGGNSGAFFTGLLAVAVAAPCIGPFLGIPVGYALSAPAAIGLLVFAMMGLGLALPYLLLSFVPGLAKILPKPGPWMMTFKQFLSFAMFGTCIWLIWTLTRQAGSTGLVYLLSALLGVAFLAWAWGSRQRGGGGIYVILGLIGLAGAIYAISAIKAVPAAPIVVSAPGQGDLTQLPSDIYSAKRLDELRAENTPVFVDFTAAWCVSCQFNKRTAIKTDEVIKAFHETGTVYMVADWTSQDAEITKALESFGRSGVPLYLYYAPGADVKILPAVLTKKMMLETLQGND